MLRSAWCNGQIELSLPGSGCLLGAAAIRPEPAARSTDGDWVRGSPTDGVEVRVEPSVRARGTYPGPVLSGLRDSRGRPNLRVKVLAIVVALLLAGPLTFFLLQGAARVLDLAY